MAQLRQVSDCEPEEGRGPKEEEESSGERGEDGGVSVGLASCSGEDAGVWRTMDGVFAPCEDCGGVGVEVFARANR